MRFLFFCLFLAACGGDEIANDSAPPIVGVLELPISLRADVSAPPTAGRVELSPTELRLDGTKLLDLERGRVPDAERTPAGITKLVQALQAGPARRAAILRLHVNLPYETLTDVVKSVAEAGLSTLAFEVRSSSSATSSTFLTLDHFRVERVTDHVTFQGPAQRGWDELVAVWTEMAVACEASDSIGCTRRPVENAQGGQLEIVLFSRGSALRAELTRFGVEDPVPVAAAPVEMLEGVPAPAAAPPAPVEHTTTAQFTWRFGAATSAESPISQTFRPLCGARECGVVVKSDAVTMSAQIISLLGAAFPTGAPQPTVVFALPE